MRQLKFRGIHFPPHTHVYDNKHRSPSHDTPVGDFLLKMLKENFV